MLPRIVSDWIEPFSEARFRKPATWADYLRPAAPVACTMPAAGLLDAAIGRAQGALLRQQNPDDGFWCGELIGGDTTVECDTIMLLHFVGQGDSPKVLELTRTILAAQLPDGGWPIYVNGSAEDTCTGTGFPRVYYLTYGLYREYFPLMALGLFRRLVVAPQMAAGGAGLMH